MKTFILHTAIFVSNLIRIILLLFLLLVLVSIATHYVDNREQYPTLMQLNKIEHDISQPLIAQIKMTIPYKVNGTDYSELLLILFLVILINIFTSIRNKYENKVLDEKRKKEYIIWRAQAEKGISKERLSEMDRKFQSLTSTKPNERQQLLKEFVSLKSKLDSMGQQLAFLSIDVVDSTGMKRDEDRHLAAYDFSRYNEIAKECMMANGVVKYATTPDGIMSCYRTVDAAVQSAMCLLERLKDFNQNEKKMRHDFQIRCGINAGFVYVDEDTPLEQVSDRVIDIAGHMQKYAKPNSINIAAGAIEPLKNRQGFSETTDVIDEQKVYEWSENMFKNR